MRPIRSLSLLLALALLLSLAACGAPASAPGAVSTPEQTAAPTEPPEPTEAPPEDDGLAGPEALTADTALFYRQAELEARRGELVRRAEAEGYFPRTHRYDGDFATPAGTELLALLDYCFSSGYAGFSLLTGELCAAELTAAQRRELELMYPIDGGKVLALDRDGCTTFWYDCRKDDTMEYFTQGLTAAVTIAGTLPIGPDEYENALAVWKYLKDHIEYGDRYTYYYNYGHQLYDALVGGVCVCSGYADALYYLFNACGIDCLGIVGLAHDPLTPGDVGDHKWNVARLYGQDYCFDLTWDDSTANVLELAQPLVFGLSGEALYRLGEHRASGIWTDETLIPACPDCFDPVAVWNDSPGGAFRSWLWFYTENLGSPEQLLIQAGFDLYSGDPYLLDDWAVTSLPWADFLAYCSGFMTEDCLEAHFSGLYREEDGMLAFRMGSEGGAEYRLVGVSPDADGAYRAELTDRNGSVSHASFTVGEADGRCRIASVEFQQ